MLMAGIILILASLVRAININNLVIATLTGDISKHYADSVIIDWSLSSFLLLMISIWIFFLASEIKRWSQKSRKQGFVIGLALTLFGATFWFRFPSSLHLPAFLLAGLLIIFPLLFFPGRYHHEKKSKGPDNSQIEKPGPRI